MFFEPYQLDFKDKIKKQINKELNNNFLRTIGISGDDRVLNPVDIEFIYEIPKLLLNRIGNNLYNNIRHILGLSYYIGKNPLKGIYSLNKIKSFNLTEF